MVWTLKFCVVDKCSSVRYRRAFSSRSVALGVLTTLAKGNVLIFRLLLLKLYSNYSNDFKLFNWLHVQFATFWKVWERSNHGFESSHWTKIPNKRTHTTLMVFLGHKKSGCASKRPPKNSHFFWCPVFTNLALLEDCEICEYRIQELMLDLFQLPDARNSAMICVTTSNHSLINCTR